MLLALVCGFGVSASPPHGFDTATLRVASLRDTATLTVELAETEAQQEAGLMNRRSLGQHAGMLFLYPGVQPANSGFWMFRTRIPLDIAFIDSTGIIRNVQTMQPCTRRLSHGCREYLAGARYLAALEVNAGYFASRRIGVGDRVMLQDTVTRRRVRPPRR